MDELKEKWYSVQQAADEARVNRQTITNAIDSGRLVASEIGENGHGRMFRIRETDLIEWIENRKTIKAERQRKVETKLLAKDMTVEDLAEVLHTMISKAYEEGFKEGKKRARDGFMEAIRGVE